MPPVVTDNYRWVRTAETTIFQNVLSCLPTDEALEKEDRIDQIKKKIKHSPPIPHLLQAQQAPALPYAKVVGRPGTGGYPAPSPVPTTHHYICIVCAKYQRASIKALVQVDFLMYALSKHKHNLFNKKNG